MSYSEQEKRDWCKCLVIWSVILLFIPVMWFEFIHYDDADYVYNNPHVRTGLSWNNVLWAFSALHGEISYYHPLTWMSHQLDSSLLGSSAGGHHLTNMVFHIANCLLVFCFLERVTKRTIASGVAAAFFGLHPLHVESVAWVSERKDVLSTFFFLAALISYLRYVERRTFWRYAVTLFLFLAGLLSKPMVVTLPCVFLLLDVWPLRRLQVGSNGTGKSNNAVATLKKNPTSALPVLIWEKVPFFALAAIFGVLTIIAQNEIGAISSLEALPLSHRLENAVVAYAEYLFRTIYPANLGIIYPHPGAHASWNVVLSGTFLVALVILGVLLRRRYPYVLFGILWYFGTLVPVIGFLQVGAQAMADRYTYIPLIGIFGAICMGASDMVRDWPRLRPTIMAAGAAGLLACFFLAGRQLQHWHNSLSIFLHTVEVTKRNNVAHLCLGKAFQNAKMYGEADDHFMKAIEYSSDPARMHVEFAKSLLSRGEVERALFQCDYALQLTSSPEAHFLKAKIFATNLEERFHNQKEALFHAEKACDLIGFKKADYVAVLAQSYAKVQRMQEARQFGIQALELARRHKKREVITQMTQLLELWREAVNTELAPTESPIFHVRSE